MTDDEYKNLKAKYMANDLFRMYDYKHFEELAKALRQFRPDEAEVMVNALLHQLQTLSLKAEDPANS